MLAASHLREAKVMQEMWLRYISRRGFASHMSLLAPLYNVDNDAIFHAGKFKLASILPASVYTLV